MNCETNIVLLYILCAIVVILSMKDMFETFASKRANNIYNTVVKYFKRDNHDYADVKNATGIDFVEYDSIKQLWRNDNLSPDTIDSAITY